jgi:hypothetical protein
VVRDLATAGHVLDTGGLVREHRGQEVVGQDALELGPDLACAGPAWHGQRYRGVPAPAGLEQGGVEERLGQDLAHRGGVEIARDLIERKLCPSLNDRTTASSVAAACNARKAES